MGYNEQWGSLASRFAEAGIVEGLVPYRKAAGQLAFTKGIVRLKVAIGQMHVRSIDLQVGDLVNAVVADQDQVLNVAALADGFYHIYAHPTVDGDGFTTGVSLARGAALSGADLASCLDEADAGNAGVPEANYDASAFKMAASVPDSDFYRGRSVKLCTVEIAGNDVVGIDCSRAHRVR